MYNRIKTAFSIGMFVAVAASTYSLPRVRAVGICEFQNGLQELSQTGYSSTDGDSLENLKAELAIRKTILNQILDCAIADATGMRSNLKSLTVSDSEIETVQNRLLSKFDDTINHYGFQKSLVNDLGIEGSKKFSAGLKEWRNSNYNPLLEFGTNFIIFAKNQELMQTAGNRLDQIKRTLQALALIDNETIRGLLQNAEDNFGKAKESNNLAKEIFKGLSWPNDSSNLIKSSLEYLKDTYQNFFDIRTESQKIISG